MVLSHLQNQQKKNSTQTIGDLNCFMTGNELNYAFKQTVSSEYTFGSGDKLIDSFPTWPSMKKYFNPYDYVEVFFYPDGSTPETSGNASPITDSGYNTSLIEKGIEGTLAFGVRVLPYSRLLNKFYYNEVVYDCTNILFKFTICNIVTYTLDFNLTWSNFNNTYDILKGYVYYKTCTFTSDGVIRLIKYNPTTYMSLRTSSGDVELLNNASQLYY